MLSRAIRPRKSVTGREPTSQARSSCAAQFRELFLGPRHLAIVMEYAAGGDMFEYVIKNKVGARRKQECHLRYHS